MGDLVSAAGATRPGANGLREALLDRFVPDGDTHHEGVGFHYAAIQRSLGRRVIVEGLAASHLRGGAETWRRQCSKSFGGSLPPGLPDVIEMGQRAGVVYLVRPRFRGESLVEHLSGSSPDPHTAVHLARQLMVTVAHAHSAGLAHPGLDLRHLYLVQEDDDEPLLRIRGFTVPAGLVTLHTQEESRARDWSAAGRVIRTLFLASRVLGALPSLQARAAFECVEHLAAFGNDRSAKALSEVLVSLERNVLIPTSGVRSVGELEVLAPTSDAAPPCSDPPSRSATTPPAARDRALEDPGWVAGRPDLTVDTAPGAPALCETSDAELDGPTTEMSHAALMTLAHRQNELPRMSSADPDEPTLIGGNGYISWATREPPGSHQCASRQAPLAMLWLGLLALAGLIATLVS